MQRISNRAIVIIAGLLTLVFLLAGSLGIAFHNGWLQVASGTADAKNAATAQALTNDAQAVPSATAATKVASPSQAIAQAAPQDEVTLYRQKLDEAYKALDEAYGQIRSLQTAQVQSEPRVGEHRAFGEDDHRSERGDREHHRGERDDD